MGNLNFKFNGSAYISNPVIIGGDQEPQDGWDTSGATQFKIERDLRAYQLGQSYYVPMGNAKKPRWYPIDGGVPFANERQARAYCLLYYQALVKNPQRNKKSLEEALRKVIDNRFLSRNASLQSRLKKIASENPHLRKKVSKILKAAETLKGKTAGSTVPVQMWSAEENFREGGEGCYVMAVLDSNVPNPEAKRALLRIGLKIRGFNVDVHEDLRTISVIVGDFDYQGEPAEWSYDERWAKKYLQTALRNWGSSWGYRLSFS